MRAVKNRSRWRLRAGNVRVATTYPLARKGKSKPFETHGRTKETELESYNKVLD